MRGFALSIVLILIVSSFMYVDSISSEGPAPKDDVPREKNHPSRGIKYPNIMNVSQAGASFHGEADGEVIGDINGVGDVNGDGLNDTLINSYYSPGGPYGHGKVYLILGKKNGWEMDINILNADASFTGENYLDQTRTQLGTNYGDVNGDGYGDFLISSPWNSDGGEYSGKVFLILGKPDGWKIDTSLFDADASFIGERVHCVACAASIVGDLNRDGFDDIMIGAGSDGEYQENAGQTYIIFGKEDGWEVNVSLSEADASFIGEREGDRLGDMAISLVGDMNGDGVDDFIIGASQFTWPMINKGKIYLFFGGERTWEMDMSASQADVVFEGENGGDNAGIPVSGLGDINGDGLDDLAISARDNSDYGLNKSLNYIIFGKTTGWKKNISLSEADASFHGEFIEEHTSIGSGKGDLNGDGLNDLVFSTYYYWGWDDLEKHNDKYGRLYVVLGKENGWEVGTNLSQADYIVQGERAGDLLGSSHSFLGDIDGDGHDDLAVSSGRNSEHNLFGGQVYFLFPFKNDAPFSVTEINAYSDSDYSLSIDHIGEGELIYIEAVGVDGNFTSVDFEHVTVKSETSSPFGIEVRLIETGSNTGIYQGEILVTNLTSLERSWIEGSVEENVTITSTTTPSVFQSVLVTNPLNLGPDLGDIITDEDNLLEIQFWQYGHNSVATWTFDSNASWLSWDEDQQIVNGTPINSDVGGYFIRINITDGLGYYDEIPLNIVVQNVAPTILTTPPLGTSEYVEYSVDLDCDDEGQGNIIWTMATGPGWLSLNRSSGYLNGTPGNDDDGDHTVKIMVEDGNGGSDTLEFIVKVLEEPDPPTITSEDPISDVDQDAEYRFMFMAMDIDTAASGLSWNMETNASWLDIDTSTGEVFGTPDKTQVGTFWILVTVSDGTNTDSINRTITVVNVNDPPEWWGEELVEINIVAGVETYLDIIDEITDIDNRISDISITSDSDNVTFQYDVEQVRIIYANITSEYVEDVLVTISDWSLSVQFMLRLNIVPSWKVIKEDLTWNEEGDLNISVTGVPGMELFIFIEGIGYLEMEEVDNGSYSLVISEKNLEKGSEYSYYFSNLDGGSDLTYGSHTGTFLVEKESEKEGGNILPIIIVIIIILMIALLVALFILKKKGVIMAGVGEEEEEMFGVGVEREEVKSGPLNISLKNREGPNEK